MAVSLDATDKSASVADSSVTWSHTIGADANALYVLMTSRANGEHSHSSVTVDGNNLTKLDSAIADGGNIVASIWEIRSSDPNWPGAGTFDVVASPNKTARLKAASQSLITAGSPDTPVKDTGTGSSTSLTVNTPAGGWTLEAHMSELTSGVTEDSGQTVIFDVNNGTGRHHWAGYKAGEQTSVSLSHSNTDFGHIAVAIPVLAGGNRAFIIYAERIKEFYRDLKRGLIPPQELPRRYRELGLAT